MRLVYTGGNQSGLQARTHRGQCECYVLSWKLRRLKIADLEISNLFDCALRAEDWLHHIHREVEQAFFQKK
jgi:hypothetical protein